MLATSKGMSSYLKISPLLSQIDKIPNFQLAVNESAYMPSLPCSWVKLCF